jgi:serine/threonine protein kinase, bacterial
MPATPNLIPGDIFRVFDAKTQDSGNVSYGVRVRTDRFFVKTAGLPQNDQPIPYARRIEYLRNAIRLNQSVQHDAMPALRDVIESTDGPILVYDWVDGELINTPAAVRYQPESPLMRFRALPLAAALSALDAIFDLHARLASEDWIAVDFYDGCLMYDFERCRLHVIDLDMYETGPFVNTIGRLFGSTRFMAPEEFELGAEIDQRTNVFTMGRTVFELLSDGTSDHTPFRGSAALRAVARRACEPERSHRFASVDAFVRAWQAARLLA